MPHLQLCVVQCCELVVMVCFSQCGECSNTFLLLHQALVDRLKPLGSSLTLATTKSGSTHIQVVNPQLQLGAEFRDLAVLPAAAKCNAADHT